MTLEELAIRARRQIDKSGEFKGVISQNIVADYLTGRREIHIRAETALDADDDAPDVINIIIWEEVATVNSVDLHINDTLMKFAARIG